VRKGAQSRTSSRRWVLVGHGLEQGGRSLADFQNYSTVVRNRGSCWFTPLSKLGPAGAGAFSGQTSRRKRVLNSTNEDFAGKFPFPADRSSSGSRIERNLRSCGGERYFFRASLTATPNNSLRSPSSICPSKPRIRFRNPPHLPERPHSSEGESFFRGMTSGLAGPLP
jgi:hypothetical protein